MKIAVLGTGMVGQALAGRLAQVGHAVTMGSRAALNPNAQAWARNTGQGTRVASFADAAAEAVVVVNATNGQAALPALRLAGVENLIGKVLIDVTNPLATSDATAPSLFVTNTDSLGEQIQREFPASRVVKTLNTMNADVMVHPELVPGDHVAFISGDHDDAKQTTSDLLKQFGWPPGRIIDLGGMATARGTEAYVHLWVSLWARLGTGHFNIAIPHA